MKNLKKWLAIGVCCTAALAFAGCGNANSVSSSNGSDSVKTTGETTADGTAAGVEVPTIDSINLGTDYQDLAASIRVLTNRTDVVDTIYKGYAEEFIKLYPNIKIEYEGVTDYEQAVTMRLTSGDWGDLCFIPNTVNKDELSNFFTPLGESAVLDQIYNFNVTSQFGGKQYGHANGGTANGVIYNKRIWDEAGIKETPKTPEEFLNCLQMIKDNTDAIPLYSNFAAGWTMGQWDGYIGGSATGNADFMNIDLCHSKDPFSKNESMSGPYAVYYTLYEATARKLIEEDPASTDWESSKVRINQGEIATMVLGSWAVGQCKDSADKPDDVAYMPFPISIDGKQYATAGGNYSYGINKNQSAENQTAAMLYLKWILEESTMFIDEGSIPALKSEPMPDVLKDFEGVELVIDNPSREGEETLFNDINNDSEVGINNNDIKKSEILEAALYGNKAFDDIMADWNKRWAASQEKLGVTIE